MYVRGTSPSQDLVVPAQLNSRFLASVDNQQALDGTTMTSTEARIHQALTATFITLCQPGPNSFVLVPKVPRTRSLVTDIRHNEPVGEARRPRFRVVIGPQLCTCRDGSSYRFRQPDDPVASPCVHVLFVMLRVLNLPTNDVCLMQIPLPTGKTEALIRTYWKSRTCMIQGQKTSRNCCLSSAPNGEPPCIHNTPSPSVPLHTPLFIPKPIHPSRPSNGSGQMKAPQLLALANATVHNFQDCCELSTLTKDIKSTTRKEAESVETTGRVCVALSPTSSSDSIESARSRVPQSMSVNRSHGPGSLTRRPQTVPQPEPSVRPGLTRNISHACSTTFRPIPDFSPSEESKLSLVQTEDTGMYGVLTNDSQAIQDSCTRPVVPTMRSPEPVSLFSHVCHSPFKPIRINPTSVVHWPAPSSSMEEDTSPGSVCALCLQIIGSSTCTDDPPVRCLSMGGPQSCRATFHFSCSQLWLEEMAVDGDSPYCPICMNPWLSVPMVREATGCNTSVGRVNVRDCCCCRRPEESSCVPNVQSLHSSSSEQAICSFTVQNCDVSDQQQKPGVDHMDNNKTSKLTALVPQSDTSGALVHQPPTHSCIPYPEYQTCVAAFSLEVADGIASRQCATHRQLALQRAAQMTVHRILLARQRHQHSQIRSVADRDEIDDKSSPTARHIRCSDQNQAGSTEPDCLRVMFRLIQHLLDDPVDAVFIDALRAFRELLGYLVCFNAETQIALQRAVGPILRRLLRFVGGPSVLWALRDHTFGAATPLLMHQDSATSVEKTIDSAGTGSVSGSFTASVHTPFEPAADRASCWSPAVECASPPAANLHDRANLALATLVELAKGQSGALAIGRDVGCASQCIPVCGLQHMTRFVLSSAKFHATHLIGRLTLLDKLIRMDQGVSHQKAEDDSIHQSKSNDAGNTQKDHTIVPTEDRLARRHLCSGLVFARRHLLPPVSNYDKSVRLNSKQPLAVRLNPVRLPPGTEVSASDVTAGLCETQVNIALDSLYNTQLKASRVARRVFLTAARALLTYGNRTFEGADGRGNQNRPIVYSTHEFCPREFVEIEINRTEAPLAAWLRSKLAPLLYPNLVLDPGTSLIPLRMVASEAEYKLPKDNISLEKSEMNLPTSQTLGSMSLVMESEQQVTRKGTRSSSPKEHISPPSASSLSDLFDRPPLPPPRRHLRFVPNSDHRTQDPEEMDNAQSAEPSPFVRVALEPAYDLVALSTSGNYIGISECEDEDTDAERDRQMDRADEFERTILSDEPTYGGRSLGSEAELQTEQAAVLRSALRRSSRSLKPLLPVPALSIVMDAFRSTNTLPSADEYYESIDWVRGPILGHGAFSQCYQARDTRTGLLMAVKRIRLGGGAVLPIRGGKVKDTKFHHTERCRNPLEAGVGKKDAQQNGKAPKKSCDFLTADITAQLTEVQAEVNIMLQLNHPNVLRLFGAVYCAQRGLVDLFVEWMPGGSVNNLLRQYGAFNESVTLAYGVQVVRGLAYLHKHGILHRDLKGANLLVDTSGSVIRISDFGASAKLSGEKSIAGQFQGQVIGTFSFMAPEVLRGETYGRACDIWSVGCCLIEMLTGQPPWHDAQFTNRYALMFAIATSSSPPTYPAGVHEDVTEILDACFARNAPDRPTASKLLTFRAFVRLIEPSPPTDNGLRRVTRLQSPASARQEKSSEPQTHTSELITPERSARQVTRIGCSHRRMPPTSNGSSKRIPVQTLKSATRVI